MPTPIEAAKGTDGVLDWRVSAPVRIGGMAPNSPRACHPNHQCCHPVVKYGGIIVSVATLASLIYAVPRLVYPKWSFKRHPEFKEEKMLRHVFNRAAQNNPASVLSVIDAFCRERKEQWMMNVGDEKGAILRQQVIDRKPQVAVELGTYMGYSAILIAMSMSDDGHLYSIEIDVLHASIATKIIEFAGLKDRVTVLVGKLEDRLPQLINVYKVSSIDLLFIDHAKDAYKPDFVLLERANLIKKGSVVIADNMIYPGSPAYAEYIRNNPNYQTRLIESKLEYMDDRKDGVEVSIRK